MVRTQARARSVAEPEHTGPSRVPGVRSTPAGQRRVPWIALGLLLVFGAGLAFAAWSRAASNRTTAFVAARDIAAGEVLGPDAIAPAELGAGPGVHTVTERGLVVGRVARGPIPAGAVLSPEMVTDGEAVPAGQAVVGALLAPGAYPTDALAPGDSVRLVETASSSVAGGGAGELGAGRVWAVSTPGSPGATGLFVSVLVPADAAAPVADAAARQALRLVLVGGTP